MRGLHWEQEGSLFHAGYTSPQSFENIFLPSQREGVFGTGYRLKLNPHSTLTPSVYYLTAPEAIQSARSGTISSLLYSYRPSDAFDVAAEIGYSRVGGSFNLTRRRAGDYLRIRFRYSPENFAALSISNLHGLYSDVTWSRQWSQRFSSDINFTGDRFNLPGFQELSVNGGALVRYRVGESLDGFRRLQLLDFSDGDAGTSSPWRACISPSAQASTSATSERPFSMYALATPVRIPWDNSFSLPYVPTSDQSRSVVTRSAKPKLPRSVIWWPTSAV